MFQYFKLDIILKQDQIFFRHGNENWLRIKTLIQCCLCTTLGLQVDLYLLLHNRN